MVSGQEKIKKALDPALYASVGEVLGSLPPRYSTVHNDEEILKHAEAIRSLTDEYPVRIVQRQETGEQRCAFTLCTWDAPGLFSYISGILGARGLNIQSGEVFTTTQGYVVDSFSGILEVDVAPDRWLAALEHELAALFVALRRNPPDTETVRTTVMERVAREYEKRVSPLIRGVDSPRATDAQSITDAASIPGTPSDSPDPPESPASVPDTDDAEPLLPIRIKIDDAGDDTLVSVTSQDTPYFLYSLANALALQDMSIRHVEIETRGAEIHDSFWIQHARGGAIDRQADRDRLQLSILVTKQFTHALHYAADPRGAFTRFEELVQRVAGGDGDGGTERLQNLLADPSAQRELARLLGASDFLWEDFIRLQYESLLPLLRSRRSNRPLSTPPGELRAKLDETLYEAATFKEQKRLLNAFKDHEAYLIDADHILQRDTDFFFLSHRLTALAEVIVDRAYRIVWDDLVQKTGVPRSAAGLPADFAVFGLGKMGGRALGYASDIELMTVYSDHGDTDGSKPIRNREFFERLVRGVDDLIETKREAIFEIDLRLRPYGKDGPKAVHVESFLDYFGPGGKAHSAERLALIRMRHIAGDTELGRRMIAVRDRLIYETDSIDVEEIQDLRRRQAEEKVGPGRLNAKFSPGALVDLEYNVQLLQIREGRVHPALRNPGIHASLRELSALGTIDTEEAEAMVRAYRFLRNLINGLRMLRGNAQDLFLPPFETIESGHLARRMGYRDNEDRSAAAQLRVDFEVETAAVRSFVERHLGESSIPTLTTGNPADLVLSDRLTEERSAGVLQNAGFRAPARGIVNLRRIAGGGQEERELFARLLVLAWDYIIRSGDPDMALNNWDRFTERVTDRRGFFKELLAQPRRIEIMIVIFAGSQFLSDTLIRNPGFLKWISDADVVTRRRDAVEMREELETQLRGASTRQERLDEIRRYRRREILRIGTKDICLGGDFNEVVAELSDLARGIVESTFRHVMEETSPERNPGRLAIFAFGKLGGDELNYSSDIDLLAVYEPDPAISDQERHAGAVFRQVVRDISDFTLEGQAYRVDLRLRPWGNAGRLVYATSTIERYYREEAELWELQALLKLGPIAGDEALGTEVIEKLQPIAAARVHAAGRTAIVTTIRHLRARAVEEHTDSLIENLGDVGTDVKNGVGGIRDIEFLVQGLQLLHQRLSPEIVTGNTLSGLDRLEEAGILPEEIVATLREDYRFLRRIEHFLQVYDDQQLHAIPSEAEAQLKLSRVVLGDRGESEELFRRLSTTLQRVRGHFLRLVSETEA
jgi:glutamate-ammonia-ligase adenylyltransferase